MASAQPEGVRVEVKDEPAAPTGRQPAAPASWTGPPLAALVVAAASLVMVLVLTIVTLSVAVDTNDSVSGCGSPSTAAPPSTGVTVTEVDSTYTLVSFDLPLEGTSASFRREFRQRSTPIPKYVVVDNHGYYTNSYDDQHAFDGMEDGADDAGYLLLTTRGSEDSYGDGLPGWNVWGWGDNSEPTASGDCTDVEDAFCLASKGPYYCYGSQIITGKGSCKPGDSTDPTPITATCSTMSQQDDMKYAKTVLEYARDELGAGGEDLPVVVFGQSMGGMCTGNTAQVHPTMLSKAMIVSAGARRGGMPTQAVPEGVKVVVVHGVIDEVVPPCLAPHEVGALFGAVTEKVYNDTAYVPTPSTCNDGEGFPVCVSSDGFFYSSLKRTLSTLSGQASLDWGALQWREKSEDPSSAAEGNIVKCADVSVNVQVCLFNGRHCLPYQDDERACAWTGADGSAPFRRFFADFLSGDL